LVVVVVIVVAAAAVIGVGVLRVVVSGVGSGYGEPNHPAHARAGERVPLVGHELGADRAPFDEAQSLEERLRRDVALGKAGEWPE
jgi:hypothetical protein